MGWKLCGLAINKDFRNDVDSLFNLLKIKNYKLEKESCFEDETIDILEDSEIVVGYFDKGTLLFTEIELMADDNNILTAASLNHAIIGFYINDTTSTYCFDYYKNGEYVRKKWLSFSDAGIDDKENFGPFLEQEKTETDHLQLIFDIISSTIGKNFYEIDENAQFLKFTINSINKADIEP